MSNSNISNNTVAIVAAVAAAIESTPTPSNIAAIKKKQRRGKRGGQNTKPATNTSTDETCDYPVAFVSQSADSTSVSESTRNIKSDNQTDNRASNTAVESNQPTSVEKLPLNLKKAGSDHIDTISANSVNKLAKKRRGKRGGTAKDKTSSASHHNDSAGIDEEEEYAPFDPIPVREDSASLEVLKDLNSVENSVDEKHDRNSHFSNQHENSTPIYNHLLASNAFYKDDPTKILPHRDPNLPNQPDFGFIDPEARVYFLSIEKMLDDLSQFETEEDRILFIQNVYREVGSTSNVKLASDSECSRVLEKFTDLFRHRFASHVVQTLLSLVPDIVTREQLNGVAQETDQDSIEETDTEIIPAIETLFIDMCEELSGQWTHLMTDPWGSHLVRATLNVASGELLIALTSSSLRSKKSQKYMKANNITPTTSAPAKKTQERKSGDITTIAAIGGRSIQKRRKVPESFTNILQTITTSVTNDLKEYELRTFCGHAVANPVLQILVGVKGEKGQELIAAIINLGGEEENFKFMESLITDTIGSHLVEKILVNATPLAFHTLYMRHFKGNLVTLCNHHVANFVIQHLIGSARNATQVRILLEELLGPDGNGIEIRNRAGVVVKILEACARHNAYQPQVLKSFLNSFHATTPTQQKLIIQLVLTQLTYEDYTKLLEKPTAKKFDYHGVAMVEQLLQFSEDNAKIFIDRMNPTKRFHFINCYHKSGEKKYSYL
ncbi:Nucleolar protein 9 [Physocladia obscura]|uniref:Nucleolar protein 9 n=1 Tax=Physocladia obscura TaxID=109957 RepID=A0AAD5SWM9_9FUNG|nr:Nucleolar protein 9 [Physocladia obscura]